MAAKPGIPKGTRDFSPVEMGRRNYIFDTIRAVFKKYGYLPLETPSMENLSTLMGKYGEEGDKLIFKILNSGDYLDGVSDEFLNSKNSKKLTTQIAEKALRYDLTVPFARYVVMHQNEITFPFKRYQIQPVWRADRPQKGRYREFYQCDADVIGSESLLNEVDLIQLIDEVFAALDLKVVIQMNNRKILSGIAEILGEADKIIDITVAIDKLDKIGVEKVQEELRTKAVSEEAIQKLEPILTFKGTSLEKIEMLKKLLSNSTIGLKGIEEVEAIYSYIKPLKFSHSKTELDITLARGLNYYTGAIFEVKVENERSSFTSSICGGGRYDDLTGIFGLKGMSGVGISFGADRIYDVLEEAGLFDEKIESSTDVLILNFGTNEVPYSLEVLSKIRSWGVSAELYPDNAKLDKQFKYALKKGIKYVFITGEEERLRRGLAIKDMSVERGGQYSISFDDLHKHLSEKLSLIHSKSIGNS